MEPLLVARGVLRDQLILIDKRVRDAAKADQEHSHASAQP